MARAATGNGAAKERYRYRIVANPIGQLKGTHMTRKLIIASALAALTITTAACNTVQGLGRDIESVGREGEEVIN